MFYWVKLWQVCLLLVAIVSAFSTYASRWRPCSQICSAETFSGKLAIFVYKFPAEINAGLYQSRTSQLTEHSAEYWLYHALSTAPGDSQAGEVELRVVLDAEEADLFYVPVFPGLLSTCWDAVFKGLELYPGQANECPSEKDLVSYEERVLAFLDTQPTVRRRGGFDHVLPCIHPTGGMKLRQSMPNAIFLAVDFMLVEGSSLEKDIIIPYTHMVPSMPYTQQIYDPTFPGSIHAPRKWLISFRGGRWTGELRKKILSGFGNFTELVSIVDTAAAPDDHEERMRLNAEDMRSSKFCFHIGGDTSSSARLFDAIVNLCIPVIVTPNLELPFEGFLDYSAFCIFVPVELGQDAPQFVDHLMSFQEDRLVALRHELAKVRDLFEYDRPLPERGALTMILHELVVRAPLVALKIKRWHRGLPPSLG